MEYIYNTIRDYDYLNAYKNLVKYKSEKGFTTNDLLQRITVLVKQNKLLDKKVKIGLYERIEKLDYSDNIGGNEKLIISNLIGIIIEQLTHLVEA